MAISPINIEQTYWDYLCATINTSNMYNEIFSKEGNRLYFRYSMPNIPQLSDCQIIHYATAIDDTDKRFWHLGYRENKNWYDKMMAAGFQVRSSGTIQGSTENLACFGLAASDIYPIQNRPILLTPQIAVRFTNIQNPRLMGTDIYSENMDAVMLFLSSMYELLALAKYPPEKLTQDILDQFIQADLRLINLSLANEYCNFTICPLIENIRRYYQENGNDLFNQQTPDLLKDEDDKVLWSVAKVRDVYLAHNRHYPFLIDGGKSIRYNLSAIQYKKNVNGVFLGIRCLEWRDKKDLANGKLMDNEKIFDTLERTVIRCLGCKDRKDLHSTLRARNFYYIPGMHFLIDEGRIPAFAILHSYISKTLFLYENMKKQQFFHALKKSKLSSEKIKEAKENLINFRNTALHEHIPIEKMMDVSELNKNFALAEEIWNSVIPKTSGGNLIYMPYNMSSSIRASASDQVDLVAKSGLTKEQAIEIWSKNNIHE